eukprot:m.39518 g.39518  ORF g.39518 m.39518 type:complete len:125 (+) comp45595_c0_seq1:225-599(+)
MGSRVGIGVVLVTQLLGVLAEIFGQREVRVVHQRSGVRTLIAVSIYSGAQAFVVLALCELLLPTSITDGQGAFSAIGQIFSYWALAINAVFNVPYWMAQAYLLQAWKTHCIASRILLSSFCESA